MSHTNITAHLALQALDYANDGISISDARLSDNPLIYVNSAFERMTGYKSSEIIGKNCRFLQNEDTNQEAVKIIRAAIDNQTSCLVKMKNYRKDGTPFWNQLSLAPIFDANGLVTHFIGVQKDVSSEVQYQDKIAFLCDHDPLTGLYNQRGFMGESSRLLSYAKRSDKSVSVGLFDIDNFKKINDTFGYQAGDEILSVFAAALSQQFRETDIVARIGADEFVCFCLTSDNSEEWFKKRLDKALAETNKKIDSHQKVKISTGYYSVKPKKNMKIESLLSAADKMMLKIKKKMHQQSVVD